MSLPASYFDRLYEVDVDPWGFTDRPYEARKRAVTVAALTRPHYRSVFEPGCSIGTLTTLLAERADRVVAMDPARVALQRAACTVPAHVELRLGALPGDWPAEDFDLIVLSEVVYYLDEAEAAEVAHVAMAHGQEVVAVHWRHHVSDYPLGGDRVHELLAEAAIEAGRHQAVLHVERDFRLEVWTSDGRSVAERHGLVG